jgi:hypothetical protein
MYDKITSSDKIKIELNMLHNMSKTVFMTILIVVFPCMLIITQLLFQQNALVY